MTRLRALLIGVGVAFASPVAAATIHGVVYEDTNRDGQPSAGEPGIANAVVAFQTTAFVVTDASGQFDLPVADTARGIVWVRVPDGFIPGPVWAAWDGKTEIDLGLRRLATPPQQPLTFVVASDTHIAYTEEYFGGSDLARVARSAISIEPRPAFFTILGDITQGSREPEYQLVDRALDGLEVPWIPVPGNHDWYDSGAGWFSHYGPDNYSFDIAGVHFVVWNMTLDAERLREYLGAELARVDSAMPVVALTHDPPKPPAVVVLRELGVDYVLTGHTHSNRAVDHGGLIELNTEPLLMGGLDFTPAGYRVVTVTGSRLTSYHRSVVEQPFVAVVAPALDRCVPPQTGELLVAAELVAGATRVTARVDCATPFELRALGGWIFRSELPPLSRGSHTLAIEAQGPNGIRGTTTVDFEVCSNESTLPPAGADWPQLGGGPAHQGVTASAITPPLTSRWVTPLRGHVLTASPVIAAGTVYVAVSDLGDGDGGGVVALDLISGAIRWRVRTDKAIRGGLAVTAGTIVTTQIDGVVLGLDATTGIVRWRRELSNGFPPQAGAVFSAPTIDDDAVLVGHQRALVSLTAANGSTRWIQDPVPDGLNSQSAASVAIGGGLAIGTFHRELGGVIAWDRATGARRWSYMGEGAVAVNASPVVGADSVFVMSGATEVVALDFAGKKRWATKLEPTGFDWGNASIATPALAAGILVVPTMYGELVGLDATTGAARWKHRAAVGPLRGTHYRGAHQPAFAASPIISGDLVWAADAAGTLTALDLRTGVPRWSTTLGSPIMTGLAASGEWLVVAGYDGTIRGMTRAAPNELRTAPVAGSHDDCRPTPPAAGCCNIGAHPDASWLVVVVVTGIVIGRRRRAAHAPRSR